LREEIVLSIRQIFHYQVKQKKVTFFFFENEREFMKK